MADRFRSWPHGGFKSRGGEHVRGRLALLAGGGLLLSLLLVLALGPWPRDTVLEVRDQSSRLLYAHRVTVGDEVVYSYLHSVERSIVVEVFQVAPTGLRLVMTSFGSAGAGLPACHQDLVTRDGRFVIEGLDSLLPELPLLGSEATRSLLQVGDDSYPLRGRITIAVRKYPVWAAGWRRATAAGP